MKRLLLVLSLISLTVCSSYSQPDTLWTRTIGGTNNDGCRSIYPTSDGGFILGGFTKSFATVEDDMFLVKINAQGVPAWQQAYHINLWDGANSVQQTGDGGYVLAGYCGSNPNYDFAIVKTDAAGVLQWSKSYGGSNEDRAYGVRQTVDGGYIVAGTAKSFTGYEDIWLLKLNSAGDTTWTKLFSSSETDYGYGVIITSDGGYLIVGSTKGWGASNRDALLLKTDASGNQLWLHLFSGLRDEYGYGVTSTSDGGYILIGDTRTQFSSDVDVYIAKTDEAGIQQWTHNYNYDVWDVGNSISEVPEGGYYAATSVGNNINKDFQILKIDGSGNELWHQAFGSASVNDEAKDILTTDDGGCLAAGITNSFGAGMTDIYLVRMGTGAGTLPGNIPMPLSFRLLESYPNPFNNQTVVSFELPAAGSIKLTVCDISGRENAIIAEGWFPPGFHSLAWNAKNANSGIYFITLEYGGVKQTRKVALVK